MKNFQDLEQQVVTHSFANMQVAWRSKGKFVCRHGLFFRRAPVAGCMCMVQPGCDDPAAEFMPALDANLRRIMTVPFQRDNFRRIGQIKADLRRLGW